MRGRGKRRRVKCEAVHTKNVTPPLGGRTLQRRVFIKNPLEGSSMTFRGEVISMQKKTSMRHGNFKQVLCWRIDGRTPAYTADSSACRPLPSPLTPATTLPQGKSPCRLPSTMDVEIILAQGRGSDVQRTGKTKISSHCKRIGGGIS